MSNLITLYPNPHAPQCFWHDYAQTYGSPNIKWCETTLCQFVSEPANTWSNLAYLFVALIIFAGVKKDNKDFLKFYPVAIFFMGLFSFIYHLSNFYLTQILDFVGMYLFVFWCLGVNLVRVQKMKANYILPFVGFFTVVMTVVLHFMYLSEIKFQMLILVVGILIALTEFMAQKKNKSDLKFFVLALFSLVLAFSFSIMDHTGVFCEPDNHLIQGHAIWHLIGSVAMYFIYRHYKTVKLS